MWDTVAAGVKTNGDKVTWAACDDADHPNGGYLTMNAPGPNGYQAEWIVERPCVGGSWPSLAPFGTMTFHYANYDNSRGIHQSASQEQIWMQGPYNQRLDSTGLVYNDERFSVAWHHYGNVETCF